jgi:starch-binding outer membrane protein, SusD/RagB family
MIHRAMFFTEGQNKEVRRIAPFTEGYAVNKFTNMTSTGNREVILQENFQIQIFQCSVLQMLT